MRLVLEKQYIYDKTGRNVSYVVKLTEHIGGRMTVVLT